MGTGHIVRRSLLAAVAVLAAVSSGGVVHAAEITGGITVAPAAVTMTLEKGSPTAEAAVGVRNNSTVAVRLNAVVQGMQQAANGTLVPSDNLEPVFSKALTVENADFTLDPGKSVNVKLNLTDNRDITPGGHYVSLLIREMRPPGKNVALLQAVSVRVFIVKEDGAVRGVTVDGVTDDGGLLRVPRFVTVSFGNAGNVAVVPRASVAVYDPRGRLVASGVLNTESVTVFPAQQAHLQTQLTRIAWAVIPGPYRLEVSYRYQGSDQIQTGQATRWIVPPLFWAVLAGFALIAGSIGWLILRIRQFRRRRKASYTVRKPRAPKPAEPTSQSVPDRPPVQRRIRRKIDI